MGWNDHVDFELDRRIEWLVENGYTDNRPEYGFLRDIVARQVQILERGCDRSTTYREMFGLVALSDKQWQLLDGLLEQYDGGDDEDDLTWEDGMSEELDTNAYIHRELIPQLHATIGLLRSLRISRRGGVAQLTREVGKIKDRYQSDHQGLIKLLPPPIPVPIVDTDVNLYRLSRKERLQDAEVLVALADLLDDVFPDDEDEEGRG